MSLSSDKNIQQLRPHPSRRPVFVVLVTIAEVVAVCKLQANWIERSKEVLTRIRFVLDINGQVPTVILSACVWADSYSNKKVSSRLFLTSSKVDSPLFTVPQAVVCDSSVLHWVSEGLGTWQRSWSCAECSVRKVREQREGCKVTRNVSIASMLSIHLLTLLSLLFPTANRNP